MEEGPKTPLTAEKERKGQRRRKILKIIPWSRPPHLRHANVRAHARGPDGREEQEGEEERFYRIGLGRRRREEEVFRLAEGEDGEGGEAEAA